MEQSEGILIRKSPWSETSLIVTWLTPSHGKIRLVAQAARRPSSPLAGCLDLFFKAEITFAISRKSDLHRLSEVRVTEPFDASCVPCANVFLGGYFAELVDATTEPGQPAADIYDLLVRATAFLRSRPAALQMLSMSDGEPRS